MRIRRLTRLAWALLATGTTLITAGVVADRWWLGAAGLAAVLAGGGGATHPDRRGHLT